MNKWFKKFWRDHGERLSFLLLATIFATIMYMLIPATRQQIVAVYFMLLGLLVNKARSPKDQPPVDDMAFGEVQPIPYDTIQPEGK